jgi:chaperonin cofactor prefoldin
LVVARLSEFVSAEEACALLEAENERLEAEVERLTAENEQQRVVIQRLRERVKQLIAEKGEWRS